MCEILYLINLDVEMNSVMIMLMNVKIEFTLRRSHVGENIQQWWRANWKPRTHLSPPNPASICVREPAEMNVC